MVDRKHLFHPCGQQLWDKSQDPFLPALEREISGVYPRSKRTPHSNDPFKKCPSPSRQTSCDCGSWTIDVSVGVSCYF